MSNKRISLIVVFVLWVAGSYVVYKFLPSWAIVVYGVVSMILFLLLAIISSGKKGENPNG